MTRKINPESFDPFKSNKDQTPECKLTIVRSVARRLVHLVDALRQPLNNSAHHHLYVRPTISITWNLRN
jgi:hypothetical protein